MVEGKRDDRLTEVPGADQYDVGSTERKRYKRSYRQAIEVLSNPTVNPHLKAGIDLSSLSIAFAENRVVEHLENGSVLKKMAENILQIGNQIIMDRRWSTEPQPQNFAWQLYGDNSPTAQSLVYAVNNNRIIEESEDREAILAKFTDIPDLFTDAQPDQTINELMYNFFTYLATELGFTRAGESIEEGDSNNITTLQHHTLPFIIRFRSNSIDIQYHRRFSWRKR